MVRVSDDLGGSSCGRGGVVAKLAVVIATPLDQVGSGKFFEKGYFVNEN